LACGPAPDASGIAPPITDRLQMSTSTDHVPGDATRCTASAGRYATLDSLRGLCACLVALMHFPSGGPVFDSPLIRHSYLMLDFFFVLSGFVIAHSYGHRLGSLRQVKMFLCLRFGRIYPLHLMMLFVLLALESLKLLASMGTSMVPAVVAFAPPWRGVESVLANITLLNGFGFYNTWNIPSWSIAIEFFAYAAFALAATTGLLSHRRLACAAALAIVVLTLFAGPDMDVLYGWGVLRCLAGFSVGVLVHRMLVRTPGHADEQTLAGSWLQEAGMILAVLAFVAWAGDTRASFVAAPLFAVAVAVFARERGAISRMLATRSMTRLGELSYSIYMIHMPLQYLFIKCAFGFEKMSGLPLTRLDTSSAIPTRFIADDALIGTLAYVAMLLLVVGVSMLSRRFIEVPGQRVARAFAQHRWGERRDALQSGSNTAVATRSP
jgi:peptidoglycan/LPS O-acetylase OafA/YrhL